MNGNTSTYEAMSDWNIRSITPMPSPGELKKDLPLPPDVFGKVVVPARETIHNILTGEDKRLLVIVGPCSIHDTDEAREYAGKLAEFLPQISKSLFIVMRTCLDKPRTGRGWPGFFNDPEMNGSRNISIGWRQGRKLLVDIISMGIPIGMELLDANACQIVDECAAYWWIGARTVTSQRLREIASGLSTAVGFKNSTDGGVLGAVEAIDTAWHDSAFIATNAKGIQCEYRTMGNKEGHLILRGSSTGTNYNHDSVTKAVHALAQRGLPTRLLIDVSHGNSGKDHSKQRTVIEEITARVASGDQHIAGFLYESYLEAGRQEIPKDLSNLRRRVSVTDACDDWDTTKEVLLQTCEVLSKRT